MRTSLFGWVLTAFLISSQIDVAAAFGAGDNSCTSATYVTPGSYRGLHTAAYWTFGAPGPTTYFSEEDWFRFTVPPGQQFDVDFLVLNVNTGGAYTGHGNGMSLFEWSPTACTGAGVANVSSTGSNHVMAVNSTPVPKDYVVMVNTWMTWMNQSVVVDYKLLVQPSTVQTGVGYCPGAPNSVGSGGTLAVQGTNSVSLNNLVFDAASLPANGFALLVNGTAQASLPFGDGTLCITGALQRLYVVPVSATGTCSVALDIQSLPPSAAISVGDLRYFQMYYRDSAGPLGTGFNLTNALAVPFTP